MNYLNPSDLSSTARCCKRFHQLAIGKLYETLRLRIRIYGPDDRTAKVLCTLQQYPHLREPLRHIDVRFDEDLLWTQSHSRLLAIPLMQILKSDAGVHDGNRASRIAPGIRSYRWTAGYTFTGLVFPDLENIDCKYIGPQNLEWLRWHLTYSAGNLLNSAALCHLRHLSLTSIDVAALQPTRVSRLELLELNDCAGAEVFLDELADEVPPSLRVMRVTAHSKSGWPQPYTAWLRSAQNIESITLCISGLASVIPLDDIEAHGSTLRTLILDARRNLLDPASVFAYSPVDLRRVVDMCCQLQTLGMPVDLRDYQRQRSELFPGVNFRFCIFGDIEPRRREVK
ncbi:unnamed protein product [Colletotrichum noveboracense]|uniref:F-box domain-containing protein n=1 Tax=Colletotrichum noveboracense TaxID=2664923 RepID=A0A9W4WIV8_9PEZI|nr:unnamed protein product [Colletotrichum noveboracense]